MYIKDGKIICNDIEIEIGNKCLFVMEDSIVVTGIITNISSTNNILYIERGDGQIMMVWLEKVYYISVMQEELEEQAEC